MHILVTGGAGFIGSHLCEQYLSSGADVTALDDLSTGARRNVEHLLQNDAFHLCEGSILSESLLGQLMPGMDTVFHFAAAVGVQYILKNPFHAIRVNVEGTEIVLREADKCGTKVVFASSSEVYGKKRSVPFREDDDRVLGPTSSVRWSYASAKAIDEYLVLAYRRARRLAVVVVRLFNVIGPRQTGRYGMVVPRFVSQALAGKPVTVYGDGTQTRTFCDVADAVRGIHLLAESADADGETFNLGGTEELSINRLAELVIRVLGSSSKIVHVPYSEAYGADFDEMPRRKPDISKISEAVGFRPEHSLEESIRRVADWMRESGRAS